MKLIAIYARNKQGIIGINNSLPWNQPKDLEHFKHTTLNKVVIMGYSTYESLKFKTLKNRTNIVLSSKRTIISNNNENHPILMHSVNDIIAYLNENHISEAYIIGGVKTIEAFKNHITHIIESIIDYEIDTSSIDEQSITQIDENSIDFEHFDVTQITIINKDNKNNEQLIVYSERKSL